MGKLFKVKPKPFIPDYKTEERLIIWYKPLDVDAAREMIKGAKKLAKEESIDMAFVHQVLEQVPKLEYGDEETTDAEDIRDTLCQDMALATDIVAGIAGGQVSKTDAVFSE